jgi:hypothetical protein
MLFIDSKRAKKALLEQKKSKEEYFTNEEE